MINVNSDASLKDKFLALESMYSKITEDNIESTITRSVLIGKDEPNSRDKRKIRSHLKQFKKIKSSINSALYSILKNLELIEPLDKTIKVLESFDNIISTNEGVSNLKDSASVLANTLLLYRILLERRVVQRATELKYLNNSILEFNNYLGQDALDTKEIFFAYNFLNYFDEVPNTAINYDVGNTLYSNSIEIIGEVNKRIIITEQDLNELYERFSALEKSLLDVQDENFKRKVNEDTMFIKRKAAPAVIAVSRRNLEEIKKSKMLATDIITLRDAMNASKINDEESITLKFLNSRIEKLKNKMEEILSRALERNNTYSVEQFNIDEFIEKSLDFINKFDDKMESISTIKPLK